MNERYSRRSILKYGAAVGGVGVSATFLASATGEQDAVSDDTEAAVRFEAQRTDGESIVLEELRTEIESVLFVATASFEVIGSERFPARSDLESHTVDLDDPLAESQQLHAVLVERNGELVAGDTAAIRVGAAEPPTVTIEDQESDGESVEVAYLHTDVDSSLSIFGEDGEVVGGSGVTFDAGEEVESLVVDLDEPLTTNQRVRATLYESSAWPIAEDTAYVEVDSDEEAALTVENQWTDGESIEVASLRTDVDSSLFVFDEDGEVVCGSGVTFDAGEEVESFVVDLEEPLSSSQAVRVTLYESNGGPIAEDTAYVEVGDVGEPTVRVEDQESDGRAVEVASLRTDVDSSLFVFDENGEVIGGSGVTFDAGDEVESLVVDLEEPLTTSQRVRATLYESNAGPIAEDTAYVEVR